jgi:acyl-coenzyme A thioesterase PaaI-like protein
MPQSSLFLVKTNIFFYTAYPPTMAPTREQLEAFAPLQWATQYLESPDWVVRERTRGDIPKIDQFNRLTMRANDGVQHWLELHLRPAPGEHVQKTVSLIKFGPGLGGFPGICHGGATLTLMDEGLAYITVADSRGENEDIPSMHRGRWSALHEQEKPLAEVLQGMYVTAKLDVKFLRPVPCPGLIGIETEATEITGPKMKMSAVMKDSKGTPLMQADGVWVRIGGAAKL